MKLFPIATLVAEDVDDFWFDYQPTENFDGIYIVTTFTFNSGYANISFVIFML